MKRNIVFLPCVNAGDGRSNPYRFSINSWKYWCDKHDVELLILEDDKKIIIIKNNTYQKH